MTVSIYFLLFVFGFYLLDINVFLGILYFALPYFYFKKKKDDKKNMENKEVENKLSEIIKDIEKRKKLLTQLKDRLKINKKPDRTEEYKDITMEIYELDQNTIAIQILTWIDQKPVGYSGSLYTNIEKLHSDLTSLKRYDLIEMLDEKTKELENIGFNTFYFDLTEAKDYIDFVRIFLKDKEEALAQRELELRKRESVHFLAKAYKQRKNTTTFKQNLSTIDGLLNLTPIEFEKWVKTNIFEKEGWTVTETKVTGDGGIDLILSKNGEQSIAQCKRFRNTVGEPLLRDFYGTMISEGVSNGYFITTGLFSLSALKFAEEKPIVLIDRRVLAQQLGGDKT
ncbi:hypothetical protein A3A46_03545 [Candidatus Roizmanbacteria bacterium RIFCSPLOWO2_01_FULL_37_13]|uniref:Restriction endonuclease type IV Mrr domain-containing protein n=1 Tax=Candidatus Roizmanbacteria bacterium RIFCSPHIGHO2_02_FULL_38_11 TaxID=1802039 RepID=A0A1F7H2G2_9BACT|nr:MAG: hypothetical protein A3C25_00470 [Candidatus Roizmanbacteria bacterium RIFCSPHIGHO2_02_FULL_38_11]OGK42706.1 MAG: hypothetical protein A3A46_03545 [Candidatus Roizmanbacteria bacterium RIFCSPLOWO2_01_FULL_37_13]